MILNRTDDLDGVSKEGQLIFPINVYESLKAAGGFKPGEKLGLAVSFWVFGNAILAWFLLSFLKTVTPKYYMWVTVGVILILQLTVGVQLLRFALDERSLVAESSNVTFTSYFRIYKDSCMSLNDKYGVIEYDDGTFGLFFQCRIGYNTATKSRNTWEVNREIFQTIARFGLSYNTLYVPEQFRTSSACEKMLGSLNTIKDPNLFTAQRDILQNLLNIAERESNVMCMTIVIYAHTQIQKDTLPQLIARIENLVATGDTCYREASFLSSDKIIEFLAYYYGITLDMGQLRAHTAALNGANLGIVKVLQLYGESGKVYHSKEDVYSDIEKIANLRRLE